MPPTHRPRLVVVGHGMVAQRLLEALADLGALDRWSTTVLAEESRPAYDRVHLSAVVRGTPAEELSLTPPGFADVHGIDLRLGQPAAMIDRARRTVTTASGEALPYDALVLATGSSPFVPPVPGRDRPGCFTYRTIDDLDAIGAWARRPGVRAGAVVGGGLLGLEAADALRSLGLVTTVVEMAPRLMPVQLDDAASAALRRHVEALGVDVRCGVSTEAVAGRGDDGPVDALGLAGERAAEVQLVVFSAGIRPRDELARAAGLSVGERGGVTVCDRLRSVTDPRVLAIGEVAAVHGRTYGLVAPGYQMAEVAAADLAAEVGCGPGRATFQVPDLSTELKLLGVDVVSFGDAFGTEPGAERIRLDDPTRGVHRSLTLCAGTGRVTGGMLVGDASGHQHLRLMAAGALETPSPAAQLLAGAAAGASDLPDPGVLPDAATVCSCRNVDAAAVRTAVDAGCRTMAEVGDATGCGTGCGGCLPLATDLLNARLDAAGLAVDRSLCEHFAHNRQDLYDLIRFHRHRTWTEVVAAHGQGRGCEVCKPTVASILASLGTGYVLDDGGAALQDTNDRALANLQRDGTYSVVPRVPAGEITPEQLIALGEIARDHGLYTKITGGQRIDLFGARLEQLPAIWARVLDAGLESGHAYGKAVRTVKSCVGSTWCRYGVQDSVAMAIRLELRYRGLRAPHKIKLAVSGCARECAEAQSKDVGVIATENGLEPLRRRQRRPATPPRPAAGHRPRRRGPGPGHRPVPDVLRAHRRPPRADRRLVREARGRHGPPAGGRPRGPPGHRRRARRRHGPPRRHLRVRVGGHAGRPGPAPTLRQLRERTGRAGPRGGHGGGAGPAAPRPPRGARHPGGHLMRVAESVLVAVCRVEDLEVERGAAALVDGVQVALFRVVDETASTSTPSTTSTPPAAHRSSPGGSWGPPGPVVRGLSHVQAPLRPAHRHLPDGPRPLTAAPRRRGAGRDGPRARRAVTAGKRPRNAGRSAWRPCDWGPCPDGASR
jgi:nitrite reductase (NADH) large subunit